MKRFLLRFFSSKEKGKERKKHECMKSCVFLRFMMRFVDLFCRFGGTAAVSSCAKKMSSKPLKKEHKNRNNKKGTRRKSENSVWW